jgi:regulator of ribosome biosynthesis
VHDDATGTERPRFGYKSAKNDPIQDWCVEVPDNADPMADHLATRRDAKKARVEKNQKQQKRNAEGVNLYEKMRQIQTSTTDRQAPIIKKLRTSQVATASMGKFDKKIEHEPSIKARPGKKRKFDANNVKDGSEAARSKQIAEKIIKNSASKESVLSAAKTIEIGSSAKKPAGKNGKYSKRK